MKVAIGCAAVAVIASFFLVAGLVGLGYWAKRKVQEVAGGGAVAEEAIRKANAIPFRRPADGRVDEGRLVKFIEVRSDVFSVYEKYRGEIEARMKEVKAGKTLDLGDISTGLTIVSEVHKAEALALAKHGMSEGEYGFLTEQVYRAMWAGAPGAGADVASRVLQEQAAASTRRADNPALPPEARAALAEAQRELASGARDAARELQGIRTSPENAALFRKYEADLRRYAMPGLRVLFGGSEGDGTGSPAANP